MITREMVTFITRLPLRDGVSMQQTTFCKDQTLFVSHPFCRKNGLINSSLCSPNDRVGERAERHVWFYNLNLLALHSLLYSRKHCTCVCAIPKSF